MHEGAKLGSKSFVAQHIFSLEIVGADEGALLRERAARASSLVCTGLIFSIRHLEFNGVVAYLV